MLAFGQASSSSSPGCHNQQRVGDRTSSVRYLLIEFLLLVACCFRSRGCATYSLVMQCISLVFAACVIGFDAYFISYPSTCYYPTTACTSSGSNRGIFYSTTAFNSVKIPLIKGQLAAGAVMFCLCSVNISLYIVTAVRVSYADKKSNVYPQAYVPTPYGMLTAPSMPSFYPMGMANHGAGRVTEVACPTCSSKLGMTVQKHLYM